MIMKKSQIALDVAQDMAKSKKHLLIDCSAVMADCATPLLQEVMQVAGEVLDEDPITLELNRLSNVIKKFNKAFR